MNQVALGSFTEIQLQWQPYSHHRRHRAKSNSHHLMASNSSQRLSFCMACCAIGAVKTSIFPASRSAPVFFHLCPAALLLTVLWITAGNMGHLAPGRGDISRELHPPPPTPLKTGAQRGWLAKFESSQGLSLATFNESFLEDLEKIEALRNNTDEVGPSETQSAIQHFLESPGETKHCRPKAEMIETVLAGADMQLLRAEKPQVCGLQVPVAMLDDRSFQGKHPRGNRGPQTSHGLYKLLRKRVRLPTQLKSTLELETHGIQWLALQK